MSASSEHTAFLKSLIARINATFTDIHIKRLLMGSIEIANKATFGNVYTVGIDATGMIKMYTLNRPSLLQGVQGARPGHYLRQ